MDIVGPTVMTSLEMALHQQRSNGKEPRWHASHVERAKHEYAFNCEVNGFAQADNEYSAMDHVLNVPYVLKWVWSVSMNNLPVHHIES